MGKKDVQGFLGEHAAPLKWMKQGQIPACTSLLGKPATLHADHLHTKRNEATIGLDDDAHLHKENKNTQTGQNEGKQHTKTNNTSKRAPGGFGHAPRDGPCWGG